MMLRQFYAGREFPSADGERTVIVDSPHWIGKYLAGQLGLTGEEFITDITKRVADYFCIGSRAEMYDRNNGKIMLSEAVRTRCGECKERALALGVVLEYLGKPGLIEYFSGAVTKADLAGATGRHAFIKYNGTALDPGLGMTDLAVDHADNLGFVPDQ